MGRSSGAEDLPTFYGRRFVTRCTLVLPGGGLAAPEELAHRPGSEALETALWSRQHAGQPSTGSSITRTAACSTSPFATPSALADAGAVAAVGSRGDFSDNALAEAFTWLSKAELARNNGPWKGIDDLEIGVAEYIDWLNHRGLQGEIGLFPRPEYEDGHYRHNTAPPPVGASVPSLH